MTIEFDGQNNKITRDTAGSIKVDRKTSDGDIIELQKDGTQVGSIGAITGDAYIVTGDVGLRFDDGNNILRPVSSSGADQDATINIGGPSQRFSSAYLSGSVYLGGTTSANALNDYEEGTFTPVMNSVGGTITHTERQGIYIKIGDMVCCWFIVTADLSSATGNYTFTGFPFTSVDIGDHNNRYSGTTSFQTNTGTTTPLMIQFSTATIVSIYRDTSGNAFSSSDTTSTSFAIRCAITYRTS